ncbi:unnamed protein product [Albugo candida]|uniref:Uncharacterized protein n=1 Tax=Albugo candida TaxID=65357 RepID=A0A024G5V9_9STRA|nr:unnamed protein product [Albugo candida]|eukprot:CCI41903.1 unnamed protein product [Albugo candida]
MRIERTRVSYGASASDLYPREQCSTRLRKINAPVHSDIRALQDFVTVRDEVRSSSILSFISIIVGLNNMSTPRNTVTCLGLVSISTQDVFTLCSIQV